MLRGINKVFVEMVVVVMFWGFCWTQALKSLWENGMKYYSDEWEEERGPAFLSEYRREGGKEMKLFSENSCWLMQANRQSNQIQTTNWKK